ncbi:acyl-CoA dehydrogenase family protein [Nonomuraea lactucae]|uniref:acyl-CoA dehydrogenase family protein n=1 Tax=Nonomuraea lactucae TaxID=2249762 RepID=UPI000DE1D0D4|nr:acyl-CoA dehydrogenase family protein [Nonomuraea lactucae]
MISESDFRAQIRDMLSAYDEKDFERWEQERHLPRAVPAALGAAGLFRRRWEHGPEGGLPRLVAMCQELCQASSGLALATMGHSEIFIGALHWLAGGPRQLGLLEEALDGRAIGCFGATEEQSGSNLVNVQTTAVAEDGGWRLTGRKRFISNVGRADYMVVLARMDSPSHVADLSLFLLPLDHPGVSVDGFFETMGLHACDVGQVTFDAKLPADALLGNRGIGLLYATHLLQFERLAICAQLIGTADVALRLAVAYARRRSLGEQRVMDKQAVRHRLAACRAELWNLESRLEHLVAGAQRDRRMPAHEISALKLTAGESVCRIIDTTMQILGARGYTRNFPLERLWRDARLSRLGGGTDEVLSDMVASGLDRHDPHFDDLVSRLRTSDLPHITVMDGN